jgi:hypothetical protein
MNFSKHWRYGVNDISSAPLVTFSLKEILGRLLISETYMTSNYLRVQSKQTRLDNNLHYYSKQTILVRSMFRNSVLFTHTGTCHAI